jgi:CheY-like chemotaxis protein
MITAESVAEGVERMAAMRFKVLVADDSAADQMLALRRLGRSCCLELVAAVTSGRMVQDYLTGMGRYADRRQFPFPDLLLLDVDMPVMDGLEVLAWIKKKTFPGLRVVMLTGSLNPDVAARALTLGADYYQSKHGHPNELNHFIRRLEFLMVLLENREPSKGRLPSMNNMLTIVDGRAPPCRTEILNAAQTGRNFILVLNSEADLEKLWSAIGTTTVIPDRLERWGLLALAEALTAESLEFLQGRVKDNVIYLVEQITINRNVPPRIKRFMLYCELRGIISHHDTVEEAGISLLNYLTGFKMARLLPLAGIYDHGSGKWERVKKLSS